MYCLEGPVALFEDFIKIKTHTGQLRASAAIDKLFVEICNPGSLFVASVSSSFPIVHGETIENDEVVIYWNTVDVAVDLDLVIRVCGVRAGDRPRFPTFTDEQMKQNNAFWRSAYDDNDRS